MIEPAVCSFTSILHRSECFKYANNVSACLANIKNDPPTQEFVYKELDLKPNCTTALFNKRQATALYYAKILEQYPPDQEGRIGQPFTYYQLVIAVKAVFENHITKGVVKVCGLSIDIDSCGVFYAKVENGKPYIFFGDGSPISSGRFGVVSEVYELGMRQKLALKNASLEKNAIDYIAKEINNLHRLHRIAGIKGIHTEGLQAEPHATFNANLQGYIGPKYGEDLYTWLLKNPPKEERRAIAKAVMLAYEKMFEIGFWHGDIKLPNILIHEGGVVIIDWAGALLYPEAAMEFRAPSVKSHYYINKDDYEQMLSDKTEFLRLAKTMDLFAISICLFQIFSRGHPFRELECGTRFIPDTKNGIIKESMLRLVKDNSMELVHIMRKMLAHDYKKRFTPKEAIKIWKKV